jgi:hypothetical protein
MRTFDDQPAVRSRVPLLLGLMGPSGGGKTHSALRLATGIQTVSGGDIHVIDTEARRALHVADRFRFRHVPFGAPFGPLEYLAAIEHCVKKGAGVIVIDSMSHEHEGPGGVLELHQAEVDRLSRGDSRKADKVKMLAWSKPKQERRRLINTLLQLPTNFVFCFRAKKKISMKRGEEPRELGWMPIAGEEFVYEMGVCALLLPGANGVPTWQADEEGSRMMIKHPEWSRTIMGDRQIDERMGAELAKWAAGTVTRTVPELVAAYAQCADGATLGTLETERRALWRTASADEKTALKTVSESATERVKKAVTDLPPPAAEEPEEPGGSAEANT